MATMDAEIPKSVETVLGPVAVDRVPAMELADEKGNNYGDFSWSDRRIRVAKELSGVGRGAGLSPRVGSLGVSGRVARRLDVRRRTGDRVRRDRERAGPRSAGILRSHEK